MPSTEKTKKPAPQPSTLSPELPARSEQLKTEIPEVKHESLVVIAPPVSASQAVAMIDAKPLARAGSALCEKRKTRRNGRVASLPKLERDMVNRMLWNGVPYKNI